MSDQTVSRPALSDEYITIVGRSAAEVMAQFHVQGLSRRGFSILGRVGPHLFSIADGDSAAPMFEGRQMVAATFARCGQPN